MNKGKKRTAIAPSKSKAVRALFARAVAALRAGQRIEFVGPGSRALQRNALVAVLGLRLRREPIWLGKPRPRNVAKDIQRYYAQHPA